MSAYDQLIALMNKRRSIHYFSNEPLDESTLTKILETGRIAPSVENTQPWHFHVIRDSALKTKLMDTSCYGNFVAGAGAFIVIVCDKSAAVVSPDTLWNPREMEYSCSVACHAMMLAATALNIGSCWVSLHHGPAHDVLKLKDQQIIVGGLMLGHMKKGDEDASLEHQRKPLKSMVTYDKHS
ncbi:hypothetical protein EXS65_01020 [Candidatus Peribacteria bacterium]|nr:hypothetical protein [Candidatus Peribacteria bacterium]